MRVALLLPATPDECRMFLGPITNSLLTFADPDRAAINGLEMKRLPNLTHVAMDGTIEGQSDGWQPQEWQAIVDNLARMTSWTSPVVLQEGDPAPF